jgi:hypothetical protein
MSGHGWKLWLRPGMGLGRGRAAVTIWIAVLMLGLAMAPGVALADGGPGGESRDAGMAPMSADQVRARDTKLGVLAAMAQPGNGKKKTGVVAYMLPPTDGGSSWPDQVILETKPRHQHRMYYCGPATIQVLSNLSWGYFSNDLDGQSVTTNKYKQTYISTTWAHASPSSGTSFANLVDGLNGAVKVPFAGFYSQWHNPSWSEFHSAIMADTHLYGLGAAAGVNPRKSGSIYFLASWKNSTPKASIGHYIPLRGYSGDERGTAKVYYGDSSGGTDEVDGTPIAGSTGNFVDQSYTVYQTMMNRYGNLAW